VKPAAKPEGKRRQHKRQMKNRPGQDTPATCTLSAAESARNTAGAAGEVVPGANEQAQEQRRRLNETQAREHVGAAGWRQTSLLEEIIRAGREQFASTDALRQVVSVTTQSLRTSALSSQEDRRGQQRTLEGIVASGHEQVALAHELEGVIERALREVIGTPLSDVNARRLEHVLNRVREQIGALNLMIEAARAQVGSLEQLQALDAVSATYQRRLGELSSLSAEEELDALGSMGEQVAQRIVEVDAPAEKQLEKLGTIGEAAVKQVAETAASKDAQLNTLEGIQAEAEREAEKLRAQD
jgi:hypothetical protein